MATMLKPPPPKKPLPDLNLPWSETDGITFRALLQEVDHTTTTTTDPEAPSSCPGPSSSSSSAAPARASGTLSASYLSHLSQGGRITTSTSTKTQTPNRSTRPKTKRLKGTKRARSDSPPVVVKPEAEEQPQVLPSVEVSPPPSVRPLVLLTPTKSKTKTQTQPRPQSHDDDDNDPGPVFPLSVEVVLRVSSRKVKAFHRGLREGIRRQVLKYYWEEGDDVTPGGGGRGRGGDGTVRDDDEAYYTAVAEGWQVYLEKVQIKWQEGAAGQEHNPAAVTLPVNLLDRRRTDEELDGYLHMMHLRGYRDYVEVWFRWVNGEPQEPDDDRDEYGDKKSQFIVIDDD